jgi:hypothetical protein
MLIEMLIPVPQEIWHVLEAWAFVLFGFALPGALAVVVPALGRQKP